MARTYEGGCLCGNIRFAAEGPAAQAPQLFLQDVPAPFGRGDAGMGGVPGGEAALDGAGRQAFHLAFFRFLKPQLLPHMRLHAGRHRRQAGGGPGAGSFDSNNRQELAPQYHSYVGKKPKWAKA